MSNKPSGEKTEKPTPKRKEDARKKGMVAKSVDLTGALTILAVVLVLPFAATYFGKGMIDGIKASLSVAPTNLDSSTVLRSFWAVMQPGVMAIAFIIGTTMLVGVGVGFAQVGVKLTPEALKPKWEVLDPFKGIQRLLGKRALFESFKALLKGIIFSYIAYRVIAENWLKLTSLVWSHPGEMASVAGGIIMTIGTRIAGVWLILAIIDFAFQKYSTNKELMMTKDELRREMKEQEGSPEVKAARMSKMRQLSRGRGLEAVKNADVIITNPTHYSVAIQYDRDKMHAPVVVAKGMDYLALKIREKATENNVPIVPNPPLARSLYKHCEVGDFVPREMFGAVAEVLAYVYRTIKRVKV